MRLLCNANMLYIGRNPKLDYLSVISIDIIYYRYRCLIIDTLGDISIGECAQ